MALHDRDLFARLLKNPKKAVDELEDKLELTENDKVEVVRLIEERNRGGRSIDEALAGWQKYAADGQWRTMDWPMGWPPWGR
jgi:hypothetical protein